MLNKHRGEFYLVMGAIFFSMNGVIVTLVLDHMTTFRLAQVRALGTFFLLFLITFIQDRNSLKAERREIPTLLFYGVFGYALALAVYFLMSQSQGTKRSAQAMIVWGFGVSGLFWSIVLPIWNFPTEIFTTDINLQGRFSEYSAPGWLLIAYIVVFGTMVPYLFVVGGIRRLSASTSSVIGMLEPVIAGVFAWIWLSQSWSAIQLLGGSIVLIGVYIADRAKTNAK